MISKGLNILSVAAVIDVIKILSNCALVRLTILFKITESGDFCFIVST